MCASASSAARPPAGLVRAVLINLVLVAASVPMKGLHVVYSLFSERRAVPPARIPQLPK